MNRLILWAALAFGAGLVLRVVDAAAAGADHGQNVKAAYVSGPSNCGNTK